MEAEGNYVDTPILLHEIAVTAVHWKPVSSSFI